MVLVLVDVALALVVLSAGVAYAVSGLFGVRAGDVWAAKAWALARKAGVRGGKWASERYRELRRFVRKGLED